jgi:hypothetical protein
MTTSNEPTPISPRSFALAWRWMRYSAFLLIPLVWIHWA